MEHREEPPTDLGSAPLHSSITAQTRANVVAPQLNTVSVGRDLIFNVNVQSDNGLTSGAKQQTGLWGTQVGMLKGETLTLVRSEGVKKVEWKQGSFFGFGGDKSQTYHECTYKMSGGSLIPVYIQIDRPKPDSFKVDSKCQFGMQNGVIFLVIHDKSQTPYQHRFMKNPKQEWLKYANIQADMSWIAGEYLCDFE